MSRDLLTNEFRFLSENISVYFHFCETDLSEWAPGEGLRNLLSLTSHIAGVPHAAAALLLEEPEEAIFAFDNPVKENDPILLLSTFQEGCSRLVSIVSSLSDESYQTNELANPFGKKATPEKVLLDTVTHLYHHRGQLHNYLKMLGKPVSTDTLYQI